MPDYDPESIPILDDVIEPAGTNDDLEQTVSDDSVINDYSKSDNSKPDNDEVEIDIGNIDRFSEDTSTVSLSDDNTIDEDAGLDDHHSDFLDDTETDKALPFISESIHDPEPTLAESALIAYDTDTTTSDADDKAIASTSFHTDRQHAEVIADIAEDSMAEHDIELDIETDTTQHMSTDTNDTPSLQSITDDIVRQIMPDLEKQLNRLVQQALEDRLSRPIEAVASSETDTED